MSTEALATAFFSVVTAEVMAIFSFFLVAIHLFRINHPTPGHRPRLEARVIRVVNWAILGAIFLVIALVASNSPKLSLFARMWLRLSVFLILVAEISYYSETIIDIALDTNGKIGAIRGRLPEIWKKFKSQR